MPHRLNLSSKPVSPGLSTWVKCAAIFRSLQPVAIVASNLVRGIQVIYQRLNIQVGGREREGRAGNALVERWDDASVDGHGTESHGCFRPPSRIAGRNTHAGGRR